MKTFFKFILVSPILLLLAACANEPKRQALSIQNQKAIHSSQAILNTAQNGIQVEQNWMSPNRPDPYAPEDSGYIVEHNTGVPAPDLVSALVISGIEDHAENKSVIAVSPIRNALNNFNYIDYFKDDLNKKLSTLSWLKLKNMKVEYGINRTERQIVNTANDNAILFIGTTYYLNSNFERLEVAAYVKLDGKLNNGRSPVALYKNDFHYVYRLASNNAKENRLVWMQNNSALLKAKLRDASKLLSEKIVEDINNPNAFDANKNATVVSVITVDGAKENAHVIATENNNYILSLTHSGVIYVVNRLS